MPPIVFDDPLPDVAFARPCIARKQGRTVEDNADARARLRSVGVGRHLRDHVLQEQKRAVVDARQPGPESAVVTLAPSHNQPRTIE